MDGIEIAGSVVSSHWGRATLSLLDVITPKLELKLIDFVAPCSSSFNFLLPGLNTGGCRLPTRVCALDALPLSFETFLLGILSAPSLALELDPDRWSRLGCFRADGSRAFKVEVDPEPKFLDAVAIVDEDAFLSPLLLLRRCIPETTEIDLLVDGRRGDVGASAGSVGVGAEDRSSSSTLFLGESCERVRSLLLSTSSMMPLGATIVCIVPEFESWGSISRASDVS